jgi:hypothetical protein
LSFAIRGPAIPGEKSIRNYVEIMRSDLSTQKIKVISQLMDLTDEGSKVFWPIYRQYEGEFFKLMDTRVDLVIQFISDHAAGTFTDAKAKETAGRFFKMQEGRLALWKDYYNKIEKALPITKAALFVQIENQVALLVDLTVASEVPYVGQDQ